MTIKHIVYLIIPSIKRFFISVKTTWVQLLRLPDLIRLKKTRKFLVDKKLEYGRVNSEESKKFIFAIEKQIEIIDMLLKGKSVV